jgi:fermentation-respiration switch protein FrsA (DUF1100 family)
MDNLLLVTVSIVMGSMLILFVGVFLITYLVLAAVLYIKQPKLLYRPAKELSGTPAEIGLDFEDVVFKSADGLDLNGWYVPAKSSKLTLLFCHGNGGNIGHRLDSINIFHNLGLSCFIFDYRGYGNSQGKPSEEGTYADAAAAYKWLSEEKKTAADDIIIFGRSLGGAIAAQLAGGLKARALVVESAFTSYVDIAKEYYPYMPVRWFARFSYNTIDYIRDVYCPVMLIYSRNDEIVPYKFGLELYDAANEPKEFIEIFGGHNDCFLASGKIYIEVWEKWLKLIIDNRVQTTMKGK